MTKPPTALLGPPVVLELCARRCWDARKTAGKAASGLPAPEAIRARRGTSKL